MTIDPPTLDALLGICIAGWCLYLTTERGRIVDDVKDIKKHNEQVGVDLRVAEARLSNNYWTKSDHQVFEDRLIRAVEKISDRLDKVISNHEERCANFRVGIKHVE